MWLLPLVFLTADPPPEKYSEPELTAEDRAFWSFVPPVRPAVPTVKLPGRVRNPIDAFVLVKLEAKGLQFSAEADKLTLIRRVTFDLIGLPPTPGEVDAFLKDDSPNAYEKVVDRLLASPHFGERQAQHWLDVVRFAESNGYELDAERPHAWRYRDYVIRSFDADKPYDVFLKEQIAGDELAKGKDPKTVPDLFVATGMHRCGQMHVVSGNLDKEEVRQEILTETVTGIGSAVLGLTIACARCHDHKFDPLSQADFYRLQAFFAGTKFADVDLASGAEQAAVKEKVAAIEAKTGPIRKQIAAIDAPYRKRVLEEKTAKLSAEAKAAVATPAEKRSDAQKKIVKDLGGALTVRWDDVLAILAPADAAKRSALREQLFELNKQLPPPAAQAWALTPDPKPAPTHVLKRGSVKRKASEVSAAVPRVANPDGSEPKTRTEFADWLADPQNPLTARVIVNRLWAHHFGRGIVNTPNDFGTRGGRPSHPELLDWLATELVRQKWSLKSIHRLMVTSAAYRQASETSATDPDNVLLGHTNRRRLDAESIRDAMLVAAGTLNPKQYGPGVKVPLEPEVYNLIFTEDEPDGLWHETPDPAEYTRRSVYLFAKRNVKLPMLEAFDQPDTLNSCAARPVSTFAPQALILMNGPFAREQAARMAFAVLTADVNPAERTTVAYRRAFGREPTAAEQKVGAIFLAEQTKTVQGRVRARQDIGLPAGLPRGVDPAVARALADYCLGLLNSNEFVYVD